MDGFSTCYASNETAKNTVLILAAIHGQSVRFQIYFLQSQRIILCGCGICNFSNQTARDRFLSLHGIECQCAIDFNIGFPIFRRIVRITNRHCTGFDFTDHSGCDISFHTNIGGFLLTEISRLNRDIFNHKFVCECSLL